MPKDDDGDGLGPIGNSQQITAALVVLLTRGMRALLSREARSVTRYEELLRLVEEGETLLIDGLNRKVSVAEAREITRELWARLRELT